MSEILRPCPFCGSADIRTEPGINLNYCDKCSAEANIEHWNTRPIEDALEACNAVLEAEVAQLKAENAELRNERTLYDNYMSDEAMRLIFANIKALEEEVTRLREQLRWIPITERKPEHDGFYSALENINQVAGYYSWSKKSGWSDGRRKHIDSVTHWMHLPKTPKEE